MNQKLLIGVTVFLGTALLVGVLTWNGPDQSAQTNSGATVTQENGVQVIHILARGGYSPRIVNAQAGVATRLDVETKATYDCSASISIPKLNIQEVLTRTGVKSFEIPAQEKGAKIEGTCSMGMYGFTLAFN